MPAVFSRWPNEDFDLGEAYIPLPEAVLDDLMSEGDEEPAGPAKKWAPAQMDKYVYRNRGFFVIDGASYPELDPEQRVHFTKRLAPCLGKPIVHHSKHLKQDLVTDVKDKGVRFTSSKNQNFSSSNQEAVEHTESTELPTPIGAFLLHSIQPAYKGGANRFVNAYTLLDTLEAADAGYLEVLKRPFSFDTGPGANGSRPRSFPTTTRVTSISGGCSHSWRTESHTRHIGMTTRRRQSTPSVT